MPKLRRSKRNRPRCWTRKNKAGKNYRVCNKSRGQKGVYKRKAKKHRGGSRHNKSRSHNKSRRRR